MRLIYLYLIFIIIVGTSASIMPVQMYSQATKAISKEMAIDYTRLDKLFVNKILDETSNSETMSGNKLSHISNNFSYIDINKFYVEGNNICTDWIDEYSSDNSSNYLLEIEYIPKNISETSRVSWPLEQFVSEENDRELYNIAIPITVTILGKGLVGDEWVDLQINASGKSANYSIIFEDILKETNYIIFTNKSIDEVSLAFNPSKNPTGATIFLQDININYKKVNEINAYTNVQTRRSI